MRTSKKRINELDKLFRDVFGKGNTIYAAGEYNASAHAYIKRDNVVTQYENNTAAFFAAMEMLEKAIF